MMPRLMPWSSSPVPASCMSRKKSTMEWTAVSLCPTPTVSTNMLLYPAASHSTMVSRVLRATPPSEPADGEGRMNAPWCCDSFSMRVLSPSMEPLVRSLEGSMASTASLPPCFSTCRPNTSIDVDLPAPGTPVMPIRRDLPLYGRHFSITSCAIAWCAGCMLSTSVTARLSMVTSPLSMPSMSSEAAGRGLRLGLLFRYGFTWGG